MDASYLEVGTEVIVWKPRYPQKERLKGHHGTIVRTLKYCDELGCCISGDNSNCYWFPEELILASDEELLRPEERR